MAQVNPCEEAKASVSKTTLLRVLPACEQLWMARIMRACWVGIPFMWRFRAPGIWRPRQRSLTTMTGELLIYGTASVLSGAISGASRMSYS